VLSFLEAVQRPFDLQDRTWLGMPAALPAHLIISALLAGALAWLWRPRAAGVLLGGLILAKEAVDLMIIALYQPVTWAYASGSVVDVLVSAAGAWLGLWVGGRGSAASRKRAARSGDGVMHASRRPNQP
jgi:alkanesulfonate monooxygenase SsuD/methylene tetrahydromethanopterin reductase-like flavin-dependent oxidoreductase (luciferase family)